MNIELILGGGGRGGLNLDIKKMLGKEAQQSILKRKKKVMTIVYVLKRFFLWHYYFPQRYAVHVLCQGSKNGHRIKTMPASFTSETQWTPECVRLRQAVKLSLSASMFIEGVWKTGRSMADWRRGHKMLTAIQYFFIMTYGQLGDVKTGHGRETHSGGLLL